MVSKHGLVARWARAALPKQLKAVVRTVPAAVQASRLGWIARDAVSPEQAWAALKRFPTFSPQQKSIEILGALREFAESKPKTVLEIGAASGGTSFLLSRIAAMRSVVISIDLNLSLPLQVAMRAWARPGQRTVGLRRNSHSVETAEEMRGLLESPLDVLFIDGDHSYEGVYQDFVMYSPMVREGGLIAFHDIVPDSESRGGPKTLAWSGGVPRLWSELKKMFGGTEHIEDCNQDGYGIGILSWPGKRSAVLVDTDIKNERVRPGIAV